MKILYLKYAVEIAKIGSLNKAAEELCIAQPNLSRAIKELEKELNIVIFERNAKGMTLTPDGEKLIQYGRKILKEIDDVERLFSDSSLGKKRFSVSVPRASYIGDAFASFSLEANALNNVEMFYKETNALRAIKNILEEDYNLGIIRYAVNYDSYYKTMLKEKDLYSEVLNEFRYTLIMNKNNPLALLPEIRYTDLENYVEIAHADPYVPSLPFSMVRKEELPDNIRKRIFVFERASQFEVLCKNTSTFMWVSPMSQSTLSRFDLVQRECVDNVKKYKDVLIYRNDYKLSSLDKAFISELDKSIERFNSK